MVQLISVEAEDINYPIIIKIPNGYWCYSQDVEYILEENDTE